MVHVQYNMHGTLCTCTCAVPPDLAYTPSRQMAATPEYMLHCRLWNEAIHVHLNLCVIGCISLSYSSILHFLVFLYFFLLVTERLKGHRGSEPSGPVRKPSIDLPPSESTPLLIDGSNLSDSTEGKKEECNDCCIIL